MFVRNFLQAGDHITVVPAGIKVTLQYNERGLLEKVYVGHKNNQILHTEMLSAFVQSKEVPTKIPITKGTSFVYGCLYTDKIYTVEGRLDKEVEMEYLTEFQKDPTSFRFYAGYVQSYAAGMNLPMAIHRWLASTGFNVLPGYVVPPTINENNFSTMLNLESFPFKYPRIQSYIQFRSGKYEFPSTKVRQIVVKSIKRFVSYDGYIVADIYSHSLGVLNVQYSDIVRFNIHEKSILLVNEDNVIIDCYNPDEIKDKLQPAKINCEYCGRVVIVPSRGRITCSDAHCISVMHIHINHMLSTLGLELLSHDAIKEYGKTVNNIVSLPDILDLDPYKERVVEADLPKILFAAVPTNVVSTLSDWMSFCTACNNSIDSVKYYLQNPDKILEDLNLNAKMFTRLHHWLKDPQNLNDVIGLMEHPSIKVIATGKRFEGAPIFRGKSIYLTGMFSHGSFDDVKSILTSYSAEVLGTFNTSVDCVIVGDLHERISGVSVNTAKKLNIPVFEESQFFNMYDIDTDLRRLT